MSQSQENLNTEQAYLRRIDARIKNLSHEAPDSTEMARMQAARADVAGRMSKEDLAAYDKARTVTKSKAELAAEAEAERVAIEANRDKPAI